MTSDTSRPPADSIQAVSHFSVRRAGGDDNADSNGVSTVRDDHLSIEEPLAIILGQHGNNFPLVITMRTPGNDFELATGFLFAEGIVRQAADIQDIAYDQNSENPQNTVLVQLAENAVFDQERLQRHFFTHSACGVCGKTAIQALEMLHNPELLPDQPVLAAQYLHALPKQLQQYQQQFAKTGGVHSAALFDDSGNILAVREDVGRHNAMDKLIGSLLLGGEASLQQYGVLVSGRASFELVQKALMANLPLLAAIGAPTSLAVQLAQRHSMTLCGFLKADSFNVYSHPERISH